MTNRGGQDEPRIKCPSFQALFFAIGALCALFITSSTNAGQAEAFFIPEHQGLKHLAYEDGHPVADDKEVVVQAPAEPINSQKDPGRQRVIKKKEPAHDGTQTIAPEGQKDMIEILKPKNF